MRILITNTGPWGTGSFTVAEAVMKELIKLGHQVKLFFPDIKHPSSDLDYYYSKPDIFEIWKFPLANKSTSLKTFPLIIPDPHPRNPKGITFLELSHFQYKLYIDSFESEIKKVIDTFQPDIIECQHIWVFDHIIQKLNHPYICVAHHSDQLGFKYDTRMQPIALESAKNSEYIFAISNFVKNEVVSLYNVPEKKVIVLPNGYNKEVFKTLKVNRNEVLKSLGLKVPLDARIISFAGKISRTKGIDVLLKANKLLDPKEKIHFLILGSGNINNLLSEEEKKLCSFDRVHFLGHQIPEILAKIHNISDFSILPSRSEGFGIACLEAMACGLPMIVTNTGGLSEYAVGAIINPNAPQEIVDAIRGLVQLTKSQYHSLSRKATKIANQFSWTTISKQRLSYYKKVQKNNKFLIKK